MTLFHKGCLVGLAIFLSIGAGGQLRAQSDELQVFRTLLDEEKYGDAAPLVPKLQELIKNKPQLEIALVQAIIAAPENLPPALAASISNVIFTRRPWDGAEIHQKVMTDLFEKMMKLSPDDVRRLYYDTIWASAKSSYFPLADEFFKRLRTPDKSEMGLYSESISAMDQLARIQGTAYASRAASHIVLLAAWMEFTEPGSSDAISDKTDELCKTYTGGKFAWKSSPGSWRQANDIAWNCAVWDVARKRNDVARGKFTALENWNPVLSNPSALPIYDLQAITSENPGLIDPIFILYFKPRGMKHSLRYNTQKLGRHATQSLAECQEAINNVLACFLAKMDGYSSPEIKLRLGTFPDENTADREKTRLAANDKLSNSLKDIRLEVNSSDVDGRRLWVLETDYSLTLDRAQDLAGTISKHHEFLRPQIVAPKAY